MRHTVLALLISPVHLETTTTPLLLQSPAGLLSPQHPSPADMGSGTSEPPNIPPHHQGREQLHPAWGWVWERDASP